MHAPQRIRNARGWPNAHPIYCCRDEHASQQPLRNSSFRPLIVICRVSDKPLAAASWVGGPGHAGPQLLRCTPDANANGSPNLDFILIAGPHEPPKKCNSPVVECLSAHAATRMRCDGQLLIVSSHSHGAPLSWTICNGEDGTIMQTWSRDYWCTGSLSSLGTRTHMVSFTQNPRQHLPNINVMVTDVNTLEQVTCPAGPAQQAANRIASSTRAQSEPLSTYSVQKAILSADNTLLAISGSSMGYPFDKGLVNIMCVCTGACLASTCVSMSDMEWSPKLPMLFLRGYLEEVEVTALEPNIWVLNASHSDDSQSTPDEPQQTIPPISAPPAAGTAAAGRRSADFRLLKHDDVYPGHIRWTPCGELLVLVTSRHRDGRTAAIVYEAANGCAIWHVHWDCWVDGRDVSSRPSDISSVWADPCSWGYPCRAFSSAPNAPSDTGPGSQKVAFFHAAQSLVTFQRGAHGVWAITVSKIETFARGFPPQLDHAGRVLVGRDLVTEQLVHEDLRSGKRHVITGDASQGSSGTLQKLAWAPLPQGWRPLYACQLSESASPSCASTGVRSPWCIAVVDAYAHALLHCWSLSDLLCASASPLSKPSVEEEKEEEEEEEGEEEEVSAKSDIHWSPDSRHLAILSQDFTGIFTFLRAQTT